MRPERAKADLAFWFQLRMRVGCDLSKLALPFDRGQHLGPQAPRMASQTFTLWSQAAEEISAQKAPSELRGHLRDMKQGSLHEKHLNIATCKWWFPFILVLKKRAMFQMVAECIF